jgi:hypothetical protein
MRVPSGGVAVFGEDVVFTALVLCVWDDQSGPIPKQVRPEAIGRQSNGDWKARWMAGRGKTELQRLERAGPTRRRRADAERSHKD